MVGAVVRFEHLLNLFRVLGDQVEDLEKIRCLLEEQGFILEIREVVHRALLCVEEALKRCQTEITDIDGGVEALS